MVEPFSDRLLRKREALLRSLAKPREAQDYICEENDTSPALEIQASGHNNLRMAVHRSIKNLLKLGFTFSQILDGSGVSESFLRKTFQELSLDLPKGISYKQVGGEYSLTHDPISASDAPEREDTTSLQEKTFPRSVEKVKAPKIDSELRLFMLKTRLEINRLRGFTKLTEVRNQLNQEPTKLSIQKVKGTILANLEEFFHDIEATGSAQARESQVESESPGLKPERFASDSALALEGSRKRARTPEPSNSSADKSANRSAPSMVCISANQLASTFLLTLPPARHERSPPARAKLYYGGK